jgi:tetratricopeptide (TPR) repeat protein
MFHKINQIALSEFNDRHYDEATQLLSLNRKLYPNVLTCHNFGAFLLETHQTRSKKYSRIAIQALKEASVFQQNFFTYSALGDLYSNMHMYDKAVRFLGMALQMQSTFATKNNLACAYFNQKNFCESLSLFESTLTDSIEDAQRYSVLLSTAFASYYSHAPTVFSYYEKLKNEVNKVFFSPDLLKLAYLLEDRETILSYRDTVYSQWVTDIYDKKIVASCTSGSINRHILHRYRFHPEEVYQCLLLECPIHPDNLIEYKNI